VIKYFLIVIIALLLSGCTGLIQGQLYTNITQPYSTDFRNTPISTKRCVLDEYSLSDPVSGYGVKVAWNMDLIRSAAEKAGITNIAYTEVQTVSILMGIYSRRRLIIYGD
jgi:hypothetical protein